MSRNLARSIGQIFRKQAAPTSLRRLQREGFNRVSVLDLGELERLIGEAIERALNEAEDGDPGSRGHSRRVARKTRIELLKLLGDNEALERLNDELRSERGDLAANIQAMSQVLTDSRADLEARLAQAGDTAFARYEQQLDNAWDVCFNQARQRQGDLDLDELIARLRLPLRDAVLPLLHEAVQSRTTTAEDPDSQRIELLERRIKKLQASLDEAESMLTRVQRGGPDEGVASEFKEVQGLASGAENYEQRRSLMQEIFQLNLDLREEIESNAGSAAE